MAEAMIISPQLDASPDKTKQSHQLHFHQQQQLLFQQQAANVNHNNNDNNNCSSNVVDGCFPGYMYSCYPFVIPPAKLDPTQCQEISSGENCSMVVNCQQQQQLQQLQLQQQQILLQNNLIPGVSSGYMPSYYSLVPLPATVTGEAVPLLTNQYHHPLTHPLTHPQHLPLDGHSGQAVLGPIVGYPLSYFPHHYHLLQQQQYLQQQQQLRQQNTQSKEPPTVAGNMWGNLLQHQQQPQQQLQHQQLHSLLRPPSQLLLQPQLLQLPQQYINGSSDIGNNVAASSENPNKVIIMKDASIQTEFNEKISNKSLCEFPNSFWIGNKDTTTTHPLLLALSNPAFGEVPESQFLSKATDTISLVKGKPPSATPNTFSTPTGQQHSSGHCRDNQKLTNQDRVLMQVNNFHPYNSTFSPQGRLPYSTPPLPFHQNPQAFYLPVVNSNNQLNFPTNLCQFPISSNMDQLTNFNQPSNFRKEMGSEAEGKQKFYRKNRSDLTQKPTNPVFEVNKEFTDLLNAAGSFIAQTSSTGNSEPSTSRGSSRGADLSRPQSGEKGSALFGDNRSTGNGRCNFSGRPPGKTENAKLLNRNVFDIHGKMTNYVPLSEFGHLPFGFYKPGLNRRQNNLDLTNWAWNAFQKNHDLRSTKRKQQKRQMLANKAAEEELEEISKERDNLLKGMLGAKQLSLGNNLVGDTSMDAEGRNENKEKSNIVEQHSGSDGQHSKNVEQPCYNTTSSQDDVAKFGDFVGGHTAPLEFIEEPLEGTNPRPLIPSQKPPCPSTFTNNNSLEENPSPLSQMSPLNFSPPLSCPNDLATSDDATAGSIILKIHSRRFREYCNQVLDKEIDGRCVQLLQDLVKFQDQMYHVDPSEAKLKKRFVLGLREVAKHLKAGKLKCVIISPNLEQTQSKGGLDEALKSIIEMCQAQEVPFIFALGRRALGRACAKLVPVSVVGIFSYEGVEENFSTLKELTEKARVAYLEMVNSLKKEAAGSILANNNNKDDNINNCDFESEVVGPDKYNSSPSKLTFPNHSSIVSNTNTATTTTPLPLTTTSTANSIPPGGFEKLFPHLGHSRTPSACSAISFVSSVLSEPISENLPQSEPETDGKGCEIEKPADGKDIHVDSKDCHGELLPPNGGGDLNGDASKINPHLEIGGSDHCVRPTGGHSVGCLENGVNGDQGHPAVVGNVQSIGGTHGIGNTLIIGRTHGEFLDKPDVLPKCSLLEASTTKTILTSIRENQELEMIGSSETRDEGLLGNRKDEKELVQDLQPNDDHQFCHLGPSRDDDNDGDEKWLRRRRLSERSKRTSYAGDTDDGNDADTEEDRVCRSSSDASKMVADGILAVSDKSCEHLLSSPSLSGILKSCRRRSKEDKSDDDKTIILSKDEEDALVFAAAAVKTFENHKYFCRGESPVAAAPSVGQVEVLLARFTMTEPPRKSEDEVTFGEHQSGNGVPKTRETPPNGDSCQFTHLKPSVKTTVYQEKKLHPPAEDSLLLANGLPINSSTTSRIESWVAESQKALRGLALVNEDDVDEDGDVDDDDDVNEDDYGDADDGCGEYDGENNRRGNNDDGDNGGLSNHSDVIDGSNISRILCKTLDDAN